MTYKKIALISTAIILTVSLGVVKMETSNAETKQASSTSTEIPFTLSTPTDQTAVPSATSDDTSSNVTSSRAVDGIDTVTPVDSDNPPARTAIFSASSNIYNGNGMFDLPNFSSDTDWSVDFSYTCDNGKVFAQVATGSSYAFIQPGTSGPFPMKVSHIRIVVPDEALNCQWSVSVS